MKLILCLLSLLFFTSAKATEAEVFFVKGVAKKISSEGLETRLVKGVTLLEADSVKTENNSFVILKINKHSIHRVEENSLITIEKLPYFFEKSKDLEVGGSFYLKLGTILSNLESKQDTESLRIKTKNAVMGVRGTQFMASINKESDLILSVKSGLVEIENPKTRQYDFVESKESIVVEKGLSFTAKKRYDFQKDIDWNLKNKKLTRTFQKIRSKANREIRERRSKWIRNNLKYKKTKDSWGKKQARWKKRTKKLTRSKKRVLRRRRIEKLRRKSIKPQSETSRARKKVDKYLKVDRKRDELRKLRQKRKRRPYKLPPKPSSLPGTSGSSNSNTSGAGD